MNALPSILTGAKPGPRRMLVYGTAGMLDAARRRPVGQRSGKQRTHKALLP